MPRDGHTDEEVTHDTARDESLCGVFCDAEPKVSFEAFGYIFHWCRECYEEPCSRCQSKIAQGEGENRAKGWCQSCREEIRLICGDDERGIQKEEGKEQATLVTDGGREQHTDGLQQTLGGADRVPDSRMGEQGQPVGEEDPEPLERAGVKKWDDGSTTQLWECPDCGLGIGPETTCACGWRDNDRWQATMEKEGLQ